MDTDLDQLIQSCDVEFKDTFKQSESCIDILKDLSVNLGETLSSISQDQASRIEILKKIFSELTEESKLLDLQIEENYKLAKVEEAKTAEIQLAYLKKIEEVNNFQAYDDEKFMDQFKDTIEEIENLKTSIKLMINFSRIKWDFSHPYGLKGLILYGNMAKEFNFVNSEKSTAKRLDELWDML